MVKVALSIKQIQFLYQTEVITTMTAVDGDGKNKREIEYQVDSLTNTAGESFDFLNITTNGELKFTREGTQERLQV